MENKTNNEVGDQEIQNDFSQNKFKLYLENNPVKGSLIWIGLSILISSVTYYDYFLDGDDYVFAMLPLLTVITIISTVFFIVANIIKKIRGK